MPGFCVVLTGMLMFGGVAAQHFTAGLANPQMHPTTIDPNALFTAKGWIVGFRNQGVYRQIFEMLATHRDLMLSFRT